MLHKKRRRTRKTAVLQKKEELLESNVSFDDDDDELLVEINSTEINSNSLSYNSQLHSSKSNPGKEMSEESLQQTWSRRWKWSLGHSLWQAVNSPFRRSNNNLFTLGLLLVFIFSCTIEVQGQPPPPPAGFLDFDNLPVTRFSCEGKVIGGYYADVETGCQMFHVCTLGQKDEVQDIKFLCLNGTVFDQETRVCERVDEVDCSKAEQFFDLNLDLYAPHVATPKPPEQDLEEEDANISPVSTSKPTSPSTTTTRTTTTTKRPTTTTPKSLPTTTSSSSSSSRTRLTTPQPPEATTTKGYSSFNYYLKTPHSHVASGYNSQSRQSYIFNHKPNIEDESEDNSGSYTVSENTARKIPSGPKTIVYTPSASSSTARPSNNRAPSRNSVSQTSSTTPAPAKVEEIDEQYADEYYEDELPLEYDVSSSTAGSQQSNSKQSSYELEPRSSKTSSNSYSAQPQTQYRGKPSQNTYDFRDGRSTGSSKGLSSSSNNNNSNNNHKGSKGGSESVSVAVSRSKATISPPVITRPPNPKHKVINVTTTTTTEEPYYYDDDYPEDEVVQQQQQQQQQPAIIVRGTSSSTSRSAGQSSSDSRNTKASSNTKSNTATSDTSGPSGPSGPTGSENDNEYYDDGGDGPALNVNDHHFTHVDVPRIPFAKPNVPRVLVTNGKPFLPRLRRQSIHHKVLDHSAKDTVPMVDISSLWDSLAGHDEYNDPHSHKHIQNIPLNSDSSSRIRRNIPRSLSKLNLEVNRARSSVINSKVSTDNNNISGVTKQR